MTSSQSLSRSHYISRQGYVVRKNCLSDAEERKIRRELHVNPFNPIKSAFGGQAQALASRFKVYRESERKLYLPRFYGRKLFGKPGSKKDDLADDAPFEPTDLLFHGELRDVQLEVVQAALKRLRDEGGGILQLRCGFGKTILALYLFAALRVKTLVVVHKEFLLNQWRERIEQFLPMARVGQIQQSLVDTEGKDIVIAMLQSVSMRTSDPSVFAPFGLCCFDECHHLGAEVFSRALVKTATRYMLGLSATPDRKDGLRKVFEWYLGSVIAAVDDAATFGGVQVETERVHDASVEGEGEGERGGRILVHTAEGTVLYREDSPGCRAKLLKHLVESASRMAQLEKRVAALAAVPGRRVLVLSERRQHLTTLGERLAARGIEHGFYWGGEKQAALDEAATKQIILGTFHMASEGMDIPALNAVVLASPKSDVKQSVGRILRRKDHPVPPLIVDFVDYQLPCFMRQYFARRRLYKKSAFRLMPSGDGAPNAAADVALEDPREDSGPTFTQCAFIDTGEGR